MPSSPPQNKCNDADHDHHDKSGDGCHTRATTTTAASANGNDGMIIIINSSFIAATAAAAPSGSGGSGGGGGAVFLDTVTVELTTGTDLVVRPYGHSVSGRHMMLSQAGTLWKATRSAREKRFYSLSVAAATQRWGVWPADEATASGEPANASVNVNVNAKNPKTSYEGGGNSAERASGRPDASAARAHHSTGDGCEIPLTLRPSYTAAAAALAPFLPRYFGTRRVACLKVGSIGFSDNSSGRDGGGGGGGATPLFGSFASSTGSGVGVCGDGTTPHLAQPHGTTTTTAAAVSTSASSHPPAAEQTSSPVSFGLTEGNASRVVIQSDAVRQVLEQFARDKVDATADAAAAAADDACGGGGRKKGGDKITTTATRSAGVIVAPASAPRSPSPSPPPPPSEQQQQQCGHPAMAACDGTQEAQQTMCSEVVAAAAAQIEEEMNRRLPPRHGVAGGGGGGPGETDQHRGNSVSHSTNDHNNGEAARAATAAVVAPAPPAASQQHSSDSTAAAAAAAAAAANTNTATDINNTATATATATATPAASHRPTPAEGWVEMIVLEDVCYGFKLPCVMDMKMGTRQHAMGATAAKILEKDSKARISASHSHGIRIAGYKRWSASQQCYEVRSKHDIFTLGIAEVQATLWHFLSGCQPGPLGEVEVAVVGGEKEEGVESSHQQQSQSQRQQEQRQQVRERLAQQLERLSAAFAAQSVFCFYTSSLLLVYDAADPAATCRAVMIDFAYAYERRELVAGGDPDGGQCVDEGYMTGLASLIAALRGEYSKE